MCRVFYNLVIQFIYLQIFYVVKPVKVNSVSVSGYCIGSEYYGVIIFYHILTKHLKKYFILEYS